MRRVEINRSGYDPSKGSEHPDNQDPTLPGGEITLRYDDASVPAENRIPSGDITLTIPAHLVEAVEKYATTNYPDLATTIHAIARIGETFVALVRAQAPATPEAITPERTSKRCGACGMPAPCRRHK
jgi:hypothetical protein